MMRKWVGWQGVDAFDAWMTWLHGIWCGDLVTKEHRTAGVHSMLVMVVRVALTLYVTALAPAPSTS